jgi:hypothetical protein
MRKAFLALAAVICLLSSTAAAQLVNSYYFIPVVTHAAGLNGTSWQSDVTITNVGPASVLVGTKIFYYAKTPAEGKGLLILADHTPVNCNVASPPTSHSGLLVVSSRTYNTGDPKGTYSTAVDMNLAAANFTTYPSVMTGVRQTGSSAPGFRTNLSVANLSTKRIGIFVKIFNSSGTLAAPESPQTVEPLSFRQWTLSSFGVTNLGSTPGHIEVRLDPTQVADPCTKVTDAFCSNPCDPQKCPKGYEMRSQPTFYAYASTIDNGTGDGTVLSSYIDWQGYNKWVGDYTSAHCPSIKAFQNNLLSDWFRDRGLIEPDPPPTFRKVGR